MNHFSWGRWLLLSVCHRRHGEWGIIWDPTVWRWQQLSGNMDKVLTRPKSPNCKNQCSWEEKTRKIQRNGAKGSLSLVLCLAQARVTSLIPLDDPTSNGLQRENPSFTAQPRLPKRGHKTPSSQHTMLCCARTPSGSWEGTRGGTTQVCTMLCEQGISAELIYQTRNGLSVLSIILLWPPNFQCTHLQQNRWLVHLFQSEFKLK